MIAAAGSTKRIKKFYSAVSLVEEGGRFAIRLDAKPARTRAGAALALPNRALAEAVAAEWEGEGEAVDFEAMRLTRLAATAIDLAPRERASWAGEIVSYFRSDLLCYRAQEPAALVARQEAAWAPFLAWARDGLGAAPKTTAGVVPIEQEGGAVAAIARASAGLDDWRLIGARMATILTGSAVLGLALERAAFPAEAIFAASRLDERFQTEKWGVDADAARRESAIEAEFMAAARWLELLRRTSPLA